MVYIIKENKTSIFKIQDSKFLGFIYDVNNIDEINEYIKTIKEEHASARHICYAYVLNKNFSIQKYNDDKEPHKTAGFPILNLLIKNQITNCLIVVVRYFGGTKLGANNLFKSYLHCAELLIENNKTQYIAWEIIKITFDYDELKYIDHLIKINNVEVIDKNFSNKINYTIKYSENGELLNLLNKWKKPPK